MALTTGWQQYATYNPITPINQAFPTASTAASTTTTAKPTGMDPLSIGLGIAGIGASIFGASAQEKAAQKQAAATEEAARIAAASTEKAAKYGLQAQLAGKLGGFGLDYLTARYESGPGAAASRMNAARDFTQRVNLEANNPSAIALRSAQRYEDRLRNAFGQDPVGYVNPLNTFV